MVFSGGGGTITDEDIDAIIAKVTCCSHMPAVTQSCVVDTQQFCGTWKSRGPPLLTSVCKCCQLNTSAGSSLCDLVCRLRLNAHHNSAQCNSYRTVLCVLPLRSSKRLHTLQGSVLSALAVRAGRAGSCSEDSKVLELEHSHLSALQPSSGGAHCIHAWEVCKQNSANTSCLIFFSRFSVKSGCTGSNCYPAVEHPGGNGVEDRPCCPSGRLDRSSSFIQAFFLVKDLSSFTQASRWLKTCHHSSKLLFGQKTCLACRERGKRTS